MGKIIPCIPGEPFERCWIDDLPDEVNGEGEIGIPAGPDVPFAPAEAWAEELEGEGETEVS